MYKNVILHNKQRLHAIISDYLKDFSYNVLGSKLILMLK